MEQLTPIGDADERYLEEIARDCEVRLGPGAELVSLSQEAGPQVVQLRLRYRIGDRDHESQASGASLFDAHRALRDRIVIDRIRFGFADLVLPA